MQSYRKFQHMNYLFIKYVRVEQTVNVFSPFVYIRCYLSFLYCNIDFYFIDLFGR
jgi:hypothetical protein